MAKLKQWYFYILLFLCTIFFFVNDFGIVEIQKTAIVLGIGIDREGDDFSITAQLAVPQKSEQSGKTSSVEVSGVGRTVGEALSAINASTGWYPKLTFCELIVLGETATEGEVFAGLEYFLRNENVSDHALVATYQGNAKEFFSTKTPTADMSTLAMEKILSSESKRAGVVLPVSLREFSIACFSEQGGYLPTIVRREQENENTGSSGGGEEENKDSAYLFDATRTSLFSNEQKKGELTPIQTLTLGILKNDIRLSAFPISHAGIDYTLGIRKAKTDVAIEKRKDGHGVRLALSARVVMLDSDTSHTVSDIAKTDLVEVELLQEAEKELTKQIYDLLCIARETKCDLMGLKNLLHKKFPRNTTEEWFDLDVSISVKLQNL